MSSAARSDSDPTRSEAQRMFGKACALSRGEIILHDRQHPKTPGLWAWINLKRSAALFKKVLQAHPHHWNSMWMLGKVWQRLGDERAAFDWFAKACEENHNNIDVPREASLSAMKLGFSRHAIEYCEEALKLAPDNAGLICNLALAHLHDGKPMEALATARQAREADPNDPVCVSAVQLIEHINTTKANCPKTSAELEAYCRKNKGIFRST